MKLGWFDCWGIYEMFKTWNVVTTTSRMTEKMSHTHDTRHTNTTHRRQETDRKWIGRLGWAGLGCVVWAPRPNDHCSLLHDIIFYEGSLCPPPPPPPKIQPSSSFSLLSVVLPTTTFALLLPPSFLLLREIEWGNALITSPFCGPSYIVVERDPSSSFALLF